MTHLGNSDPDVFPLSLGGESETILGNWMRARGNRGSVVLATKVGKLAPLTGLSAATVAAGAEASLVRLGTDYIDLYYAHADDPETSIAESVAAFQALVDAGKVRQIGLSNYSGERIREWMAEADAQGVRAGAASRTHGRRPPRARRRRNRPARCSLGVLRDARSGIRLISTRDIVAYIR
jgi:aryl-alcohol dehydrogenase-like predicted oxidoreductase